MFKSLIFNCQDFDLSKFVFAKTSFLNALKYYILSIKSIWTLISFMKFIIIIHKSTLYEPMSENKDYAIQGTFT